MPKNIFLYPFDIIDVLPLFLIVGSTQSGKAYITKMILDLVNPKLKEHIGVIVVGADKKKSEKYEEIEKEFETIFIPEITDDSFESMQTIADEQLTDKALIFNIWDDFFIPHGKHLNDLSYFATKFRHHQFVLILQSHVLSNTSFPTNIRNNAQVIIISRDANKDIPKFEEIVTNSVITKDKFREILEQTKTLPYCFLCYCKFKDLKGVYVISESKFLDPSYL